jgi:Tfp pilus assembly protein PilF
LIARGVPAEAAAPLRIDDEMRKWAREQVPDFGNSETRLNALLLSLINRKEAPFVYTLGSSSDALEAWETGQANCLTFSHVFVALAREVGLDTYYLRVRDVAKFERQGDLVVASDHVTAAFGAPQARIILDFSPRPVKRYHYVEYLSDLAALALHYSNLGAAKIQEGDLEGARGVLETAVRIEPAVADGWLNLGVVRRRTGDLAGAESAYRRALETDPDLISAYQNLATVLHLLGRTHEGREILALAQRAGNRNPFSFLALGDLAMRDGRIDAAERLFRRAHRLAPEHPEPLAALGQTALARGKRKQARQQLERALRLGADNQRVVLLAARLNRPTAPV